MDALKREIDHFVTRLLRNAGKPNICVIKTWRIYGVQMTKTPWNPKKQWNLFLDFLFKNSASKSSDNKGN